MKLTQLFYFCCACDCGTINMAAKKLHISQPTISMAIHELEAEFGVMLLQRNNKGFSLTREGQYFYEKASNILAESHQLEEIMLDMGNRRKRINLGIPPMIGTFLFPLLYQGFHSLYPDIELISQEGSSEELAALLDENKLDLAIVTSNLISDKQYDKLLIRETELVFCIRPDHPLAKRESVSVEDIADIPLVLFRKNSSQSRLVESRFARSQCQPHIIFRSGQLYALHEFISRGLAAGFLFREIALASPNIKGISLTDPLPIQISIIWKPGRPLFRDALTFLHYAKSLTQ